MSQLVEDGRRTGFVAAHVDEDVHKQLLALARQEDRSLASVLRRAIAHELERADDKEMA